MILAQALLALTPFANAPRSVADALARRATDRHFATDEVLFVAGSEPRGWFVVVEGLVRVVRGAGARQHVVHSEGPGGTLGEVPLFGGGTYPATAIASEPTRCALFTRDALASAMADEPAVAFVLLGLLSRRVRTLVDRLDERSARSVRTRLAAYLRSRKAARGASTISLGMTQQELAEELGTVREVVSRELRSLHQRGIVESVGGGRYRVIDAGRLK